MVIKYPSKILAERGWGFPPPLPLNKQKPILQCSTCCPSLYCGIFFLFLLISISMSTWVIYQKNLPLPLFFKFVSQANFYLNLGPISYILNCVVRRLILVLERQLSSAVTCQLVCTPRLNLHISHHKRPTSCFKLLGGSML